MVLKRQAKAADQIDAGACRALVAGALAKLNVQTSSKGSSSYQGSSASTTSSSSRPQYTRGSGRFSSRSSVSSRRSILGSSELVTRPTMRMRNEATLVGLAVALRFPPLLIDPTTVTRKTSPLPMHISGHSRKRSARCAARRGDSSYYTISSKQSHERQTFTAASTHLRRLSRSSTTSDLSTVSGKWFTVSFDSIPLFHVSSCKAIIRR